MPDQTITVTYGDGSVQPVDVSIAATEHPPAQPAFTKHVVAIGNTPAKRATLTLTPGAVVVPPAGPTPNAPVSVGALIFDDEFSSSEKWGTVWSQDRGGPGGKMNNVTTDPTNVSISGGAARLVLANSGDGAYMSTFSSDGGGGFMMGLGYAEARIMLPVSNGQLVGWPAWWTVGNNWPADGETDIVEGLGGSATSNYHGTTLSRNSGSLGGSQFLDGGWHTYGVDRQAGQNVIYWDSKEVTSYPTSDGGAPNGLILNIGSGSGPTVDGALMQVDYVRVWEAA